MLRVLIDPYSHQHWYDQSFKFSHFFGKEITVLFCILLMANDAEHLSGDYLPFVCIFFWCECSNLLLIF